MLLVDDDPGFRALLRTTFEDVHVDVDEAGSAAQAEARIADVRPDVIVLDVGMPGMDGLAFCRSLPERCGVVAVPNSVFYDDPRLGSHLVRLAFCKRVELLEQAVERLATLRP